MKHIPRACLSSPSAISSALHPWDLQIVCRAWPLSVSVSMTLYLVWEMVIKQWKQSTPPLCNTLRSCLRGKQITCNLMWQVAFCRNILPFKNIFLFGKKYSRSPFLLSFLQIHVSWKHFICFCDVVQTHLVAEWGISSLIKSHEVHDIQSLFFWRFPCPDLHWFSVDTYYIFSLIQMFIVVVWSNTWGL